MQKSKARWAERVARMGIREMPTGFRYENMKKRGYLEDLVVDGRLT